MTTKHIGDQGEALAAEHLSDQGYRILEQNYRYERAEVDLVCLAPDETQPEIVFVEVKTRTSLGYGTPEEAVTDEKQAHVVRAAKAYMYERRLESVPVRFDVISILLNQDEAPTIKHFEDAFWAS